MKRSPSRKPTRNKLLEGRQIVVGICGGIAAYKVPELVRMLVREGAGVHCILTANGTRFVTPLTLQTLSRNRVCEGMFDPFVWDIEHVSLAQKADLVVVAPATADTLSRLAAGRADDLLSSVVLATRAPVLLCPSMNDNMLTHPATAANLRRLKGYGYHFVNPAVGELACGTTGTGRLAERKEIFGRIVSMLASRT